MELNRYNIVLRFEGELPDELGFESRVIGSLLDALEGEGVAPSDIAVVEMA